MFLILGVTGRCGSSSMMLALKDTIGKKYVSEPFNAEAPPEGLKFQIQFQTLAADMKSYDYAVAKTLHYQLETVEENMKLIRQFDKLIFMYRRHMVDFTVSEHISSTYKDLTGTAIYHKYDFSHLKSFEVPQSFYTEIRKPIDLNAVEDNYNYYSGVRDQYLDYFKEENIDFTTIPYEDMFTQSVRQNFFNLCDMLKIEKNNNGLRWLSPEKRLNSNTDFEKLIPNYNEVLALRENFNL